MGKLKVLPSHTAAVIAAGEVVQRPASVVKELMENAVDAGADKIDVVITDAGRTMIQVIDNGCGMSAADAVLCFERHATSKIAEPEDLGNILTYGFRGEAVPSIAAVSEITLRTRRNGDDTATQVVSGDFGALRTSSVSAPVGTSFCVRNLFYNTPARRKFLKSDTVEFKHIVEEFTRVAMIRPDVAFSLTHNGRDVFVLRKAKSLKFRVTELIGANVVGDLIDIDEDMPALKIKGFVGLPQSARKVQGNQYFFVCGRYFRSPYLHKAVMKAYEEMIPEGVTPSYFIFLDVDPSTIDVNIHPAKTEIKFEDESVIFQIIYACVKETLGRSAFGATIDFETDGAVQMPQLGRSFGEYKASADEPSATFDPNFNPFVGFDDEAPAQNGSDRPAGTYPSMVDRREDYGALFQQTAAATARAMVLQDKYILTPSASGLMIVNIRRAYERILYDRAIRALAHEEHVTQTALFPVQVQVGVQARLLFEENAAMLSDLGFDISPLGTDTVAVGGVPEGFSCEGGKVQRLIEDLVLILSDSQAALSEIMVQNMARRMATLGAINSTAPASGEEAQKFVDTLFASENAEITPGGRRIVCIVGIDEIEKKF